VRVWFAGLVAEVAGDWFAWVAKSVRWKKSEPSKTWQAKRWTWWSWWARWTTGHTVRGPSTFRIRLSPVTRRRRGIHRRPGQTAHPEHNRYLYTYTFIFTPYINDFCRSHHYIATRSLQLSPSSASLILVFPDLCLLSISNCGQRWRGLPLGLYPLCVCWLKPHVILCPSHTWPAYSSLLASRHFCLFVLLKMFSISSFVLLSWLPDSGFI